jgi:phosphoribosylformylglycinamidine synthase
VNADGAPNPILRRPPVLVLHATGTNRDHDAVQAVKDAGGRAEIMHVNALHEAPHRLHDFRMLVLPGGFSYGDDLGAGRLWASDLRWLFQGDLARFIEAGKPVLGICNGFQALVKSGWLPGPPDGGPEATLTRNASNRFECRWVWLQPDPTSPCVFTRDLAEPIYCPVAHGEGRFVPASEEVLIDLRARQQVAVVYVDEGGAPAVYPSNPNGSVDGIAGICNEAGNVLGLMPHPEDHIRPTQHPRWTRGDRGHLGLVLFERGVHYAGNL